MFLSASIRNSGRLLMAAMFVECLPHLTATAQTSSLRDTTFILRPVPGSFSNPVPSLVPYRESARPRVALVLSGGGARGVSAIGVLRSLEEHRIPIDLIVGTSMGSIVGGLYASGYTTEELARLVDTTNWGEILSLDDEARRRDMFLDQKLASDKSVLVLRFDGFQPVIPQSFSSGQRLTNYLNLLTLQGIYHPDPSFDDLRVPFRAVATDLVSGRRVVMDRGNLAEALRASVAIPLLFSSVRKDSMQLLDGGLVDNMPVDVAREAKADVVIVVDVTSPMRPASQLNAPWEVADQITTIMMQVRNSISRSSADVLITPELGPHLSSDFTGLDTLMMRGESATDSAISAIRSIIAARTLSLRAGDPDALLPRATFRWMAHPDDPAIEREADSLARTGALRMSDVSRFVASLNNDGCCDSARATVDIRGGIATVTFEGTVHPVLQGVTVLGTKYVSADSIAAVFTPEIGRPVNALKTMQALEKILELYREHGYSLARVVETRWDSTGSHAVVRIDEGIIAKSEIQGTVKTRDWVVWRELPWHDGDVFNTDRIAKGIANLNGTNLFEQVLVDVRHDGPNHDQNVAIIKARERSTELIRFGLRADNERNIQPSIDLRDENFLGAGAEIGLLIGGGSRNQTYMAEAKATRIFNSYLTFDLKGYHLVRDINVYSNASSNDVYHWDRVRTGEFREIIRGGAFSFGSQLERLGSVTVAGRLEKHEAFNIFATPITNQSYSLSTLRFGTTVDSKDRSPYPTDGTVLDFSYESSLVKFIESVGFTKMYFSYEKYQTVATGHTIHPKFVLGIADEALPITEQFTLGGEENFFGLNEDNARGRQMLFGSLEYQYKLPLRVFFDTYIKARYDIGAIWLKPEEIRLVDLQHGIGVTLGFDTPIGPAEFSLGRSFFTRKEILDNPVSLGPYVFYFSIGYPIFGLKDRQ